MNSEETKKEFEVRQQIIVKSNIGTACDGMTGIIKTITKEMVLIEFSDGEVELFIKHIKHKQT